MLGPAPRGDIDAVGAASRRDRAPVFAVTRQLGPAAQVPWVADAARTIRLYNSTGEACTGTVGAHLVLARVRPHSSRVAEWAGAGGRVTPLDDAAIAAAIWDESGTEGRVRAAPVEATRGDCTGSFWARAEGPPAIVLVARRPADESLRRRARAAFRALDGYKAIQTEFAAASDEHRHAAWDARHFAAWDFAAPGRAMVWTAAHAGIGCGGFAGDLVALWEYVPASGEPRLMLRFVGTVSPDPVAMAVTDDRPSFFMDGGGILQPDGETYRLDAPHVPDHDCPC